MRLARAGAEELGVLALLAGLCVVGAASMVAAAHTGHGDASRAAGRGMEDNIEEAGLGLASRELQQLDKSQDDPDDLLWTAASQGDVEGVTLALMDGADINMRRGDFNNTPLLAAAREGYHAVVVELLNNTLGVVADVNATDKNNASALFISSQYGHTDVVKELIAHNASVDFPRAGFNDTPLFIASQNGHVNVVRELLASTRADVNRRDNDSNTALHVASEKGQLSVVQVLLQNGADPNMTNSLGNTPLHYACAVIGDNAENVVNETALVAMDVNVTANDGSTPLIWASWFGNLGSAELLLSRFYANKELKTNDGKTAFDQICGCLEDAEKEGVIKCPEGGCEESLRNQTRERLEMALAL